MFFVAGLRAATMTVTNTADAGAGSLRDAITTANGNVDASNTINFSVSGTLLLASLLPTITKQLTIDGTGQNFVIDGNASVETGLNFGAAATNSIARDITIQNIVPGAPVGQDAIGIIADGANLLVDIVTITTVTGANGIAFGGSISPGGDGIGIDANASTIIQNSTISDINGGDVPMAVNAVAQVGGNAIGVNIATNTVTVQTNMISNINGGDGGDAPTPPPNSFDGGNGGFARGVSIGAFSDNVINNNTISNTNGGDGGAGNAGNPGANGGDAGAGIGVFLLSGATDNTVMSNNISTNNGGSGGMGGANAGAAPAGDGGLGGLGASIQVSGNSNTIDQNINLGLNTGGSGGTGGTGGAQPAGDGGNGGSGISIDILGSDNLIRQNTVLANNAFGAGGAAGGGPGGSPGTPGLTIGVAINTGTQNPITQNDITGDSVQPGILLQNNGNDNQVEPTMVMISVCDGTLIGIAGELNNNDVGLGNRDYIIEFFNNAASSDPEQGRTFIGQIAVTTGADGNVSFFQEITATAPVAIGDFVTATATLNSGSPIDNTSEFSVPVQVEDGQDVDDISASTTINTPVAITLSGMSDTPQTFEINSLPSNGSLSTIIPLTGPPTVTGEITYTPNEGFVGMDSFTYSFINEECTGTVAIVVLSGDSNMDLGPVIENKYGEFCSLVPVG